MKVKDLYFPKLFANGSLLNNVGKETYLGFIMNSCDKEDDTICKETRALYARGNMLLTKFGHCTVDVNKNLFINQSINQFYFLLSATSSMPLALYNGTYTLV